MTDEMVSETRRRVNGRSFALRIDHPDVGRVDAETFWIIWRDGYNGFARDSARLNELFREVAERIIVLSQAEDAAPPLYKAIAIQLIREMEPLEEPDDGWVAVRRSTLQRLAFEADYHAGEMSA